MKARSMTFIVILHSLIYPYNLRTKMIDTIKRITKANLNVDAICKIPIYNQESILWAVWLTG